MNTLTTNELRQHFLDFFARKNHAILKSSSIIPANDPTLMFTTAGMVQFKDVFKGNESRPYKRAALSQKCLRVSGKQNDLEEVGRTARHHTFFEMLGNFSFGDYFKAEAIAFAWEFLIEELALPREKLWITVFGGEGQLPADDEARELWRKTSGLPEERIVGLGMEDNFWAMGDTGPCGVTSEIFFDTGSGPASLEDFENGRIVEIWNLVFLQFDRKADGALVQLPKPCIDTGMGIERIACVVQGQTSNFHIDLFEPLLTRISELVGKPYRRSDSDDDVSIRVIADHARAIAFLVAEGMQPSNEGRGYVMRRLMRRAIRHGKRLGFEDLFLHHVCDVVVETMGATYPELGDARLLIAKVAKHEENMFRRTLDRGLSLLEEEIGRTKKGGVLAGSSVFKLYDTYGFPKDLTQVIAAEHGLEIDEDGFAREMAAQQERSRGSTIGEAEITPIYKKLRERFGPVSFVGYADEDEPLDEREGTWRLRPTDVGQYLEMSTEVCAVIQDGAEVERAGDGFVEVVLQPTPFYGEAGGQVGDRGVIIGDGGLELEIVDTKKPLDDFTLAHARVVGGELRPGMKVWAGYVPEVRKLTRAHHSATHLLHAALREVLGEHVNQAGSLVDPDHLRFDYTHFEAPGAEQLRAIEDNANGRIGENKATLTEVLPFDEAKQKGAIALFGETYGDIVRVITMGNSVEFCGGTHVRRTSDIGFLLITREEAIASGTRRIEAEVGAAAQRTLEQTLPRLVTMAALVSGEAAAAEDDFTLQSIVVAVRDAQEMARELTAAGEDVESPTSAAKAPTAPEQWTLEEGRRVRDLWRGVKHLLQAGGGEAIAVAEQLTSIDDGGLLAALARLLVSKRDFQKRLERMRSMKLSSRSGDLLQHVRDVGGSKLLSAKVTDLDSKALLELRDQLSSKLPSGVICLCSNKDGKALLLVSVSKDLVPRVSAVDLVKRLAPIIGGHGGGRPELAQAGGTNPEAAEELFGSLVDLLERGETAQ